MGENEYVLVSAITIMLLIALIGIQQELESIANSLKVLASPPQTELVICPQKE